MALRAKKKPKGFKPKSSLSHSGKAVIQPTIGQYFKKSVIIRAEKSPDQDDNTVDLPSIQGDNASACSPGVNVCTSYKASQNQNNAISRHNPFSKSLNSTRKQSSTTKHGLRFKPRPDVTNWDHIQEKNDAAIEHQSFIPAVKQRTFDLKIRKRAQRTSVPSLKQFEIKKPCSNLTKMPCRRHLPPSISPISSSSDIVGTSTVLISLGGDSAMLKSYLGHSNEDSSNPVSNLDIDDLSGIAEHSTSSSTPKEGFSQARCKIPLLPSFSPRKQTPSSSPFALKGPHNSVKDNAVGETLPDSPSLFSSPVLFPTPSQHLDSSAIRATSHSRMSPKRVLFPQNATESRCGSPAKYSTTGTKTNGTSQEEEDFSFGVDVSFSELLSHSVSEASFKPHSSKGLNCYLVLEVVTQASTDINDYGRCKPELLLRLYDEKTKAEKLCYLRDEWSNTNVTPGDVVQVNASYDVHNGCYVVSNATGDSSVVVNPDTLINVTSVANSITCTRKSVFADKFKVYSGGNEAMVLGQMLHAVFQGTLVRCQEVGVAALQNYMLEKIIREEVKKTITSLETLDRLYALNMDDKEAKGLLLQFLPAVQDWCLKYLHPEPQDGKGNIEFRRFGDSDTCSCVCVSDVTDIEENIWSPRLGMKGKVDVTVELKERRGKARKTVVTRRVPLELKTGKMFRKQGSVEHRAQVIMYSAMLGERYSCPHPGGLLLYLKANHMQGLPALPHEKRGLIMARNHLAVYIGNRSDFSSMPGMLKDPHTCKHCPYLKHCSLYHRAIEDGSETSSGLGELFSAQVSHISSSHLKFFAHWYKLIVEEEQHCRRKEACAPWLSTAQEREQRGLGFSDMLAHPPAHSSATGRFLQSFTKVAGPPILHSSVLGCSANERVFVSHQDGSSWAIAMGTITRVESGPAVSLTLDKAVPHHGEMTYRIDRVPNYNAASAMAGNLADFCVSDTERQHRLRELIIDGRAPRFKLAKMSEELPSCLNSDQRAAIEKVLCAQDYALILGMPGTGKTTTIVHLVEALVVQGKSVLLVSYTHSAVDNILLKLKKSGLGFLRLGSPSQVHSALHGAIPSHLCQHLQSVQQVEELYSSHAVVATTCLGITHPIFSRRAFDVCIIDEASQLTLPVSLGPLRHASVFVLVGDHYQLPPLVMSQQAREGGLDTSLFCYLSERQPSALVSLEKQYRMNREIMDMANHLVYSGRLQCGNKAIAEAHLNLLPRCPWRSACSADYVAASDSIDVWLDRVLAPELPLLFLNTDECPEAREVTTADHICNTYQAHLVARLVALLIQVLNTSYDMPDRVLAKRGLPAEEIGVITPLKHQQLLIQAQLQATLHQSAASSLLPQKPEAHKADEPVPPRLPVQQSRPLAVVEVNTVDKYQGRDKECIIVSFVRSNSRGHTGVLLQDWRRINVAITRAKHKLLLLGSLSTLSRAPFLKYLLDYLESKNCIVTIDKNYVM